MDNYLILGHTGFVGNRIMKFFQESYNDVNIFGVSTKEIDLTNLKDVLSIRKKFNLDSTVIMCSGIKSNYGNNLDTFNKNLKMAKNICKVLENNPVKKFIFFSSLAVYGVDTNNVKISEKTEIKPDTYYGLSKYVSEQLFELIFSKLKNSRLINIRTPTIYGPNETIRAHTPSGFLNIYLDGDEVTLWGDGSEMREFIYVDDVVKIVNLLISTNFSGAINIGTGMGYSYKYSLDIISKKLKKKLIINSKKRTKEKVDKIVDGSLFNELFPKFKYTSLEAGLDNILKSMNEIH